MMKKTADTICRIAEYMLLIFMIVMVILTFAQVLCRFVFEVPLSWSEETVRMCFTWIAFLGSAIAVKENTHLVLDMLTSHFPKNIQRILRITIIIIMLLCEIALLCGGYDYLSRTWNKTLISLPLPAWTLNISVPISGLLMLYFSFIKLIDEIKQEKGD